MSLYSITEDEKLNTDDDGKVKIWSKFNIKIQFKRFPLCY